MKERSFLTNRSLFNYGKYEHQIIWFVVISLLLATTMAVSSAETVNIKSQIARAPLPILLEETIATDKSSHGDLTDILRENVWRVPLRSF